MMPFSYSIADGLIGGICTYIVINTVVWIIEKASGGRIVPPNKDEKDPWTYRIPGGVFPPWLVRLSQGRKDFWREDDIPVSEAVEQTETVPAKDTASEPAGSDGGKEPTVEPTKQQ
jgi:AGZA family xanthine/uracil permease-like MFS transporter